MRVHWTKNAEEQLDNIYNYIAGNSEEYAKRIIDKLTKRSIQILQFPESGRIVPEFENDHVREIIEGPYRIIYCITSEQIDILAVIHGAQKIL